MEHSDSSSQIGRHGPPLKKAVFIQMFFLVIPFVLMFWLCPFVSSGTLGNDYAMFPIQHQLELMFSVKTGSFPLYVPGFSGGQSSSALTLSQIYHPISHVASLLPNYWNGKALEWNTFLRLISLGLAHISLFIFLRYLKVEVAAAFVLSFITVYNLRMLDLFRYGASLESWTGFIFLVSTLGYQYLKPTPIRGPLLIAGSTYWLVCSGHPQMMYYALCGAALFAIVLPFFVAVLPKIGSEDRISARRFWLQTAGPVFAGVLLSAAYIIPFYHDFLLDNAGRVGRDYTFAVSFIDTLSGTINNFFQPLRSDVHGVFGGSSLFLMAASVPLLRIFKIRIPVIIWCLWGAALLVFLHMQGPRTLVHFLTWKYLPLASSIRIPGRLSLILPLFFLMLLTWIIQNAESTIQLGGTRIKLSSSGILAAFCVAVTSIHLSLPAAFSNNQTEYSAFAIRHIPQWVETTALVTGMAGLPILALYNGPKHRLTLGALLAFFVCVQTGLLLAYGTWIVPKADTDGLAVYHEQKRAKLEYRHLPGSGLYSSTVMHHLRQTHLEPQLAKFYTNVIPASDGMTAYQKVKMDRKANQVIVEGCPDCESRYSIPPGPGFLPDRIELAYSSFNRLVFKVEASSNGMLGLAYPYSGRWKALVNGSEVSVYRANGATNAVQVPSGKNLVEFRYWSNAAIAGMLITCLTASLIGIYFSVSAFKKQNRFVGIIIAVAGGFCLFSLWYHSLYNGQNLGTAYVWTSKPDNGPVNLAYGKPTRTSRIVRESYPNYFYSDQFLTFNNSGKAVDGNRENGSGFISNLEEKPYWYVDLHHSRDIGALVLYENKPAKLTNQRPLLVGLSDDGKKWRTAAVIKDSGGASKMTVSFDPAEKARFLLLQSANFGRLALDEIEIYPPQTIE